MYLRSLVIILGLFSCHYLSSQHKLELISDAQNTFISEFENDIWIASPTFGWNKFNGLEIEPFLLSDTLNGLDGEIIQSAIYQDLNNNYWTSSYTQLCRFKTNINKFVCFQIEMEQDTIKEGYHIFGLEENKLFVRADTLLLIYDTDREKIIEIAGTTIGIRFGLNDNLLIACPWMNGDGVEVWNKEKSWHKKVITFENCDFFKNKIQVRKVLFYKEQIWLVSSIGLVDFNLIHPCRSTVYSVSDLDINDSYLYRDKLLFSTMGNGLFTFKLNSFEHEQILFKNNQTDLLLSNSPVDIHVDKHNTLWLSHYLEGVQSFNNFDQILNKNINAKTSWNNILGFENNIAYSENKYSFINQNLYSNNNKQLTLNSNDFPINQIYKLVKYNESTVVVMGNFELGTFNLIENKFDEIYFPSNAQFSDLKIYGDSIYLIANSNIYNSQIEEISFKEITEIQTDDKIFEFGPFTEDFKSFLYNTTELWIKGAASDTLIDVGAYLNKVSYDSIKHKFYCATNSGLFQIDSAYQVSKLATNAWEIGNKSISEIEYQNGFVYMSIENKLARYNVETEELRYFTKDQFEYSPVFAIQDSLIHIAEKYVTTYPLEEAFNDTNQYELKLDALKVNREVFDHRAVDLSGGLDLHYTQNEIAFKYYTNNWHNAKSSTIRYKLLPHYPDWTIIENGEEVEFPFLPPDQYTYKIQGILPSGDMTEITSLDFDINPPWWRTTWFYTLAGLSLAASVYMLYRYRVGQLTQALRIENEMNQLEKSALQAQMNPHFIFNCLNSIQGFIMDNEKEQAMEYLSKFAKLIRLNLNASVDNSIRLDQEILILENYLSLEKLRAEDAFNYDISVEQNSQADKIMIPPMLLQPFVENAVIHGMQGIEKGGEIKVNFKKANNSLIVDIKDNGIGNKQDDKEKKHRSLGMSITEQRLAHINTLSTDSYSIEQIPVDQGTHIRVRIQLYS